MSRVPGWAGIGRERESILVREICREREEMRKETKKGYILGRNRQRSETKKHIILFFPTCYNKFYF